MQLTFLFLGKTKESYLAAGIDDFSKRLKRYAQVSIKIIKEKKWASKESDAKIKGEEGETLLANIPPSSFVVALDRTGRQIDSEELATLLTKWEGRGVRSVTFVIGGPLGLADKVLAQANVTLSLSKMTFTHEMARLILLEQLYRAFSINAGTGYHK